MGQLIYTFVARGTVVLAEYTSFKGNFNSIAMQCLEKMPQENNKFTFPHGAHTLNYLLENGYGELARLNEPREASISRGADYCLNHPMCRSLHGPRGPGRHPADHFCLFGTNQRRFSEEIWCQGRPTWRSLT